MTFPQKKHHPSDNSELVGFMSGFFSPVGLPGQLDAMEAELRDEEVWGGSFILGFGKVSLGRLLN